VRLVRTFERRSCGIRSAAAGASGFVLLRDVGDVIVTDDVSDDDLVAVVDSLNP
jgi:hypothetical protein